MRAVTRDIETFALPGPIQTQFCNGIIFKNTGDVDALIDGMLLPAGEILDDFKENFPEDVLVNAFSLAFRAGTSATVKQVTVIRIFREKVSAEKECNYVRKK